MKLIAHRGASLECQEDTLESLVHGARLGADIVECDPRITKDGKIVLFHDADLKRLTGDARHINTITYDEMKNALEKCGLGVTTLDELFENYNENAAVLLDLVTNKDGQDEPHLVADDAFFEKLSKIPLKLICGIHAPEEAVSAAKYFPPEQILAFMPSENEYESFYKAGAGIIRLWESWLDRVTPQDVKEKCPNAEVFIMSEQPACSMNGSPKLLRQLKALGADGVLLNNIRMAVSIVKEGKPF